MAVNRVKNDFSSGELDPLLHSRTDIEQWVNGARTMRNVRLLPQGGFKRRDGSRYLATLLPKITLLSAGITATTPNGGTPPSGGEDPADPWWRDRERCVTLDTWLTPTLRARDAKVGDVLTVCLKTWAIATAQIEKLRYGHEHCYTVVTSSGARLNCSKSTPFTLRDETTVTPLELLGKEVLVEQPDGGFAWEVAVEIVPIGVRDVVLITVGNRSYAAGADPTRRIFSHNIVNKS